MHQTIGLTGYIGPLTLTLNITVVVRSFAWQSDSPLDRCIIQCNHGLQVKVPNGMLRSVP